MQIPLDYPVNARATLQMEHGTHKVHGFGLMRHTFEIPDARQGSLPVVVEFQNGRVGAARVKFRQDRETGQYFRSGGWVSSAARDGAFAGAYDGEPCFSDLGRLRMREWTDLRKNNQLVWPEKNHQLGQLDTFDYMFDVNQDDVERCRREAQDFLNHCRVADKAIWVPCSEPLLRVKRSNDHWALDLDNYAYYPADWHIYLFSMDEFDEAVRWLDVLDAEVAARPRREAVITLRNASITRNGGVEDALALTRSVMSKVAEADDLINQTAEVIGLYARMKKVLEKDAQDLDADDIDGLMGMIIRLCDLDDEGEISMRGLDFEEGRASPQNRNYPLHRLRGAVDLHIRRWEDRSIAFQMQPRSVPGL